MKIVAAFNREKELQDNIEQQFPEAQFLFFNSMEELGNHIEKAEVLITYGDDVTAETIEKAKSLKWIMVMSAGVDKLPFQKLQERNILVTNVRGIHGIPMAEMAMGYMLQYAKRFQVFNKQKEEKIWNRKVKVLELYGHTLLVIGTGSIGSQIGKYAKAFGMKTIGVNRTGHSAGFFDEVYPMKDLNKALPLADYVLSVLPRTPLTKGIFTIEQFRVMKNDAVFINMGRGDAVNEEDLMQALEAGELAHAILDVFATEPLPEDHPFWSLDKVTFTPHLSAVTDMYLKRGFEIFAENLRRYIDGQKDLVNMINLKRGY